MLSEYYIWMSDNDWYVDMICIHVVVILNNNNNFICHVDGYKATINVDDDIWSQLMIVLITIVINTPILCSEYYRIRSLQLSSSSCVKLTH